LIDLTSYVSVIADSVPVLVCRVYQIPLGKLIQTRFRRCAAVPWPDSLDSRLHILLTLSAVACRLPVSLHLVAVVQRSYVLGPLEQCYPRLCNDCVHLESINCTKYYHDVCICLLLVLWIILQAVAFL